MLIETVASFVLRCAKCGQLNMVAQSVFRLHKENHEAECVCGHPLVRLSYTKKNMLRFEVMCFWCEAWHYNDFSFSNFNRQSVTTLYCPDTGIELGYSGQVALLEKELNAGRFDTMGLGKNLNFADYFSNPDITFAILDYLHQLNAEDKIACCCGNNKLEFNLCAEEIQLCCIYCGRIMSLATISSEDLERVQKLRVIKLESKSFPASFLPRIPPIARKRRSKFDQEK
jgi:hypothetical protein